MLFPRTWLWYEIQRPAHTGCAGLFRSILFSRCVPGWVYRAMAVTVSLPLICVTAVPTASFTKTLTV